MRKYRDVEKINLEMLMDLLVFSAPENKKILFGIPSVCMYVLFASASAIGRILSVFFIE
jgi:hypothetical protein